MNKYSLGKQKTLSELCESKDAKIAELEEERDYYKAKVILLEAGWGDNDVEWANKILREQKSS